MPTSHAASTRDCLKTWDWWYLIPKCHPLPPLWDTQTGESRIYQDNLYGVQRQTTTIYKCKPSSGPVIPPLQQKPWKRPQTWSLKSLKMAFSCKILAHTVETQKPNMFPSVGPLCPRNIHQSCAESTCHSRLCLCLVSCTSSAGSHTICSLRLEKTWVILFDAGNRDISLGLKLVEPQTPHHKAK